MNTADYLRISIFVYLGISALLFFPFAKKYKLKLFDWWAVAIYLIFPFWLVLRITRLIIYAESEALVRVILSVLSDTEGKTSWKVFFEIVSRNLTAEKVTRLRVMCLLDIMYQLGHVRMELKNPEHFKKCEVLYFKASKPKRSRRRQTEKRLPPLEEWDPQPVPV